jgi:hypothetical protein
VTASVSIHDGRLRIHRTGVARWFGAPVDVPLTHVDSVRAADPHELKRWNKGIRLAGIQLPGLTTSGIYRHGGQTTWWDVGRGNSALVVTLHDERLTRVIVEVGDPAVMRELERALADAALSTEPTVG